jgi:alkylation response protein AidB-like acyl-CoA dehydrogenase
VRAKSVWPVSRDSVDDLRCRARAWLAENMPRLDPARAVLLARDDLASWRRARELQKVLYDAQDVSIDLPALAANLGGQSVRVREMVGRALVHRAVHGQLSEHVYHRVAEGASPPAAGSIIRLSMAAVHDVETDTAYAVAGPAAVVEDDAGLLDVGIRYLGRQIASIGGGTTEMARNVIGERVLGFPREYAADRGVPFNQVRHGKAGDGGHR